MSETSRMTDPFAARESRDADGVWSAFLLERSPLILQVVHLFERDADEIQDCFLFVCDHLRRDGLRRLRRFRQDGPASFETWLRAVVRRLCLDWRRHRDGRFRLPRAVARLPELEREAFRAVHLRSLSVNEAFHTLTALWPALTREQLAGALGRVRRALDGRTLWSLLVRHPRMQSLSSAPAGADPAETESGLVDPQADPERDASDHERLAALRAALSCLPPKARLLVRLRFAQGLPLEEVARLTGRSGASQVERELQRAMDELRSRMRVRVPVCQAAEPPGPGPARHHEI